ncbi:unnamed protein product, partial [Candidula unifasciata]
HQGMQRHSEAWQDSLRYRRPDLSRMSGLRRITANNNPMLGDEGAQVLAEALRDDLWLKALDLQACGIGNQGARSFLEILSFNTSLVVLDIRRNPLVDVAILRSVMERLALNSSGNDQEYKWMTADPPEQQSMKQTLRTRRRATKVLNSSFGKKTTIKVASGSCRRKVSGPGVMARKDISPVPGLPWRTAARADRCRDHSPDTVEFLTSQSADVTASTANENANNSMNFVDSSSTPHRWVYSGGSSQLRNIESVIKLSMDRLQESHRALDFTNKKIILIELEQMRRQLQIESLARARADEQVITLTIENQRLKEEMNSLRKAQRSSSSYLDDESFLDSVETTFKQFNSFIDALREAGLGELASIAGLDVTQMPIINRNNHNSNNGLPQNSCSVSNGGQGMSIAQADSLYTAASFQSMPVGPSDFANGSHKPTGQVVTVPGESSALTSRQATGSRHELTRSQYLKGSVYDEESDLARQEADELYSRLVKDTLEGLGQSEDASQGGVAQYRQGQRDEAAEHLAKDSGKLEKESLDFMRSTTRESFVDSSRMHPRGESQLDSTAEESHHYDDDDDDDGVYSAERRGSGLMDAKDLGSSLRENDSQDDF